MGEIRYASAESIRTCVRSDAMRRYFEHAGITTYELGEYVHIICSDESVWDEKAEAVGGLMPHFIRKHRDVGGGSDERLDVVL